MYDDIVDAVKFLWLTLTSDPVKYNWPSWARRVWFEVSK